MNKLKMPAIIIGAILLALGVMVGPGLFGWGSPTVQASVNMEGDGPPDHTPFFADKELATGPEVTAVCLQCHADAAKQIMATSHWTWVVEDPITGESVGKQNVINNYCINPQSNEPRCTSCHVGYGYSNKDFDFTVETNVDCLVCHDTTGTYKKFPTGSGHPAYEDKVFAGKYVEVPFPAVDLVAAASSVGAKPSRANCGSCHFTGGGGDAVKHGDLDSTLKMPEASLDVHMGTDGGDLVCVDCHMTIDHEIPGTLYSEEMSDRLACANCHTEEPHENEGLNSHVDRVSCQACHIPAYAREKATMMHWDWTTAGQKNEEGKPYAEKDENGVIIYDTKKGTYEWQMDVVPEYVWFNGTVDIKTVEDNAIDPSGVVLINEFQGIRDEADARIYPVKVFTGKQFYDSVNNTLIVPKLFPGGATDEEKAQAYWKSWDWVKAYAAGTAYTDQEFSGELGVVDTEMTWLTTHMVAPADQAVQCTECHAEDGRLDWAALGYEVEEVSMLSSFPPVVEEPVVDEVVEEEAVAEVVEEEPFLILPTATDVPPVPTVAPIAAEIPPLQGTNFLMWGLLIGAAVVIAGAVVFFIRKK